MPILDPPLAYFLCTNFQAHTRDSKANFYTHYLKIAANNYNRSYQSFNNLIQFRNTMRNFHSSYARNFWKENFGIEIKTEDLKSIKNVFTFLYERFSEKNFSDQLEGNYYVYKNIFRYNLFQLFIDFNDYRCWFLTDTPIAILCINIQKKMPFRVNN